MINFLEAAVPMTLSEVAGQVTTIIGNVVDWMTSFLSAITTSNGLLLISFVLSFALFGIHVMKSLMGR